MGYLSALEDGDVEDPQFLKLRGFMLKSKIPLSQKWDPVSLAGKSFLETGQEVSRGDLLPYNLPAARCFCTGLCFSSVLVCWHTEMPT